MISAILILILSNLSISKIIRSQMKLFEAPHSLHLSGPLERRKHLIEEQPTSKVLMTNIASAAVALPLNITVQMVVTPFEEIFLENQQKVFTVKSTMIDNSTLYLNCTYQIGKKLRAVSRYTSKDKKQNTKVLEQVIQPLGWNKLSFSFYYQNQTIPVGDIKTIVQFQESKPVFKGIVTNFSIMIHTEVSLLPIIYKKQPAEWIGTVDPISHPVSLKGLVIPENLKSQKSPHTIPILGKDRKLLVCHDMMNGYKEDINQYSNKFGKNAYRFHHWRITDLFVYFSHQNIAIPPKHYRQICKREKVVCLATFIIEAPLNWLTFQMADFLIFLAKQHQFDGYLINIEYPVNEPNLFKDWLTYLTNNIHSQLPNSLIVLYDAITNDGSLRHQSGISDQNIDYMSTVDYFFSDYHWTLQSLETTAALSQSIQRGFDIFMGNDVFGRGTWGGGIFHTDVAVRQINKYNLSTAIFAPGYVYQNEGGNRNYSRFEQLDDKLWFGKSFAQKQIKYEEWQYLTKGWKQEGDDAVTSHVNCIRSYTYPLANNNQFTSITFSVNIKGTPPNTKDPYTIVLQLLDQNNNPFKYASTGNEYKFAKQEYQQVKLRIQLNEEERKRAKSVKVMETGRDAENWGGHYGVRFKEEVLFFNFWKKQKSISSSFYQRPQSLPYQSFYNAAVGPNYFFQGQRVINDTGYSFLADYDLPYQNKNFFSQDSFDENINSKHLEVNYDQSKGWVGAGSLRVSSLKGNFALKLVSVQQKIKNINVRLIIQLNKNQIPLIGLKYKDSSTQIAEPKSNKRGSWLELSAQFFSQQLKELDSVYLISKSKQSDIVINIGQISLFTSNAKLIEKYNPQLVAVRCSITALDCMDLYVNLKQFPSSFKTIFIEINGKVIGTLYQKTGYFEQITGDSNNVNIRLLGLSHTGNIQPIYNEQILTNPI